MKLRQLFEVARRYVLYAGLEKRNFREIYPKMIEQMHRDNRRALRSFSLLGGIILLMLFGFSFFTPALEAFRIPYGAMCGACLICAYVSRIVPKDSIPAARTASYTFLGAIYVFAIVLGTFYAPEELAITFFVLLVAAPLIFADRPIYFVWLIVGAYIAFMVVVSFTKTDADVLAHDRVNATVFAALSVVSCIYMMNIKLRRYELEYRTRLASETDILTGLKNRKCFEDAIAEYPAAAFSSTYFVYLDVNGLHELNNTEGHAHGDEMLRCVADAFLLSFGINTYRIGGDEFVTFGAGLPVGEVYERVDALNERLVLQGYTASIGVAFGSDCDDFSSLIRAAENKMYDSKAEHYRAAEFDRRRRE